MSTLEHTHPWVDATPFRALLIHLIEQTGLRPAELATHLELPWPACRTLLRGARGALRGRRVHPTIAGTLLSADASEITAALRRRHRAATAARLVGELVDQGHSIAEIATRCRLAVDDVRALLDGRGGSCTERDRLALATMLVWSEGRVRTGRAVPSPEPAPAPVRRIGTGRRATTTGRVDRRLAA